MLAFRYSMLVIVAVSLIAVVAAANPNVACPLLSSVTSCWNVCWKVFRFEFSLPGVEKVMFVPLLNKVSEDVTVWLFGFPFYVLVHQSVIRCLCSAL